MIFLVIFIYRNYWAIFTFLFKVLTLNVDLTFTYVILSNWKFYVNFIWAFNFLAEIAVIFVEWKFMSRLEITQKLLHSLESIPCSQLIIIEFLIEVDDQVI